MIMQAIRNEHSTPRPAVQCSASNWFRGYPGVGMLTNKIGLVAAHPANATRLAARRGPASCSPLPRGSRPTRQALHWHALPASGAFGRGGFVKTALRTGAPDRADRDRRRRGGRCLSSLTCRCFQRLTGLIYFPHQPRLPQVRTRGAVHVPSREVQDAVPSSPSRWTATGPRDADDIEAGAGRSPSRFALRFSYEVDRLNR